MSTNDLSTPLGIKAASKPKRRLSVPFVPVLGALVAGIFLLFFGWILVVTDPFGGEPVAIVAIEAAPVTAAPPKLTEGETQPADGANVLSVPPNADGAPNVEGAAAVEESSGVKVVRAGDSSAPNAVIVRTPETAVGPVKFAAADPDLTEAGRQGALPKIGADGKRPLEAYARPVVVPPALARAQNTPRIALLVGGLGISETTTTSAITKLPGAVTLAFAPYGAELPGMAAKARQDGHEVMLQSPMEPFDYPDNDPGPQTLLADSTPEQNLDRLRWQMSRFPAYTGVINYMGARFTANEAALSPVIKEVAARGLLFVDDGSSPRSLAASLADVSKAPFAKADSIIDADPMPKSIDGALAALEKKALENGTAFGVATALPISIDRIAEWSEKLAERGILLVPVSALAIKQ
jgi:polysaccharide deacetylase 2 family uncharacterized protein YibQ